MKKKILAAAVLTAAVVSGVFTGCGNDSDIGRDAALEVALGDAGVNESDATRLRVSEDRDDGRKVYEIRFDVEDKEYDYEIQASDGAIISSDIETVENYAELQGDDAQNNNASQDDTDQTAASDQAADQNTTAGNGTNQSQTGQNQNNTGSGSSSGVAVSQDEAVQIALDRVSGATAQDVRIELDRDDGRYKYEGEIIYNNMEYDFEIDANSGTILEWSEERY
ncbi:MAG: PepSY domain-containing protein [Mediterraneibacter sp.]